MMRWHGLGAGGRLVRGVITPSRGLAASALAAPAGTGAHAAPVVVVDASVVAHPPEPIDETFSIRRNKRGLLILAGRWVAALCELIL